MLKAKTLAVLAFVAAPGIAMAAPNGWSGDAGLGYIASSGNTKNSTANAKLGLIYTKDAWQNTFLATALGASSNSVSTAEQYGISDKQAYNFTPDDYAFASVEWFKDLKGPIEQRFVEAVGYGRHVLKGPTHVLDLEAGIGARQETVNNLAQDKNNDVIGRFGAKYGWKISDTSTFSEALKIETGSSNTFTESVTELKVNVVGNVFAGASFTLRNNSKVPAGAKKTDTITALNLSYAFGAK